MNKRINVIKKMVAISMLVLVAAFGSQAAIAAPKDDACAGLKLASPGATCSAASADASSGKIVRSVINILSIAVGAVAVIMVIIGGFRYVVSNGDSNSLQGAKNTILYALVGLIIVLFAQVIVKYVLARF